jgi:hypothetical protein
MQLSAHFSVAILSASDTAQRRGIDNTPAAEIVANLRILAEGLEQVMAALDGRPLRINSGFRCAQLNSAIGGAAGSMHMQGLAADILCPEFGSPLEVCRAIVAHAVPVDQIIHEYGRWCHVAFAPAGRAPRRQQLTIASAAQGYLDGLHPVG